MLRMQTAALCLDVFDSFVRCSTCKYQNKKCEHIVYGMVFEKRTFKGLIKCFGHLQRPVFVRRKHKEAPQRRQRRDRLRNKDSECIFKRET